FFIEEGMPFFCFTDCFFELRRHIRAYSELDPAEAFICAPVTIRHKIMLIACRVGTESYGLYPFGQEGEGADKNAELLMSRRYVAVPELRVKDKPFFRPVGIQ